jgi:6,7-dimethyl-8-ribityllumazine synthase
MEDAASTDADAEAARDMPAGEAEATLVRVRGHFEIPIERTVLACAEDPDALLADVIEEQRHADVAGETEPEED